MSVSIIFIHFAQMTPKMWSEIKVLIPGKINTRILLATFMRMISITILPILATNELKISKFWWHLSLPAQIIQCRLICFYVLKTAPFRVPTLRLCNIVRSLFHWVDTLNAVYFMYIIQFSFKPLDVSLKKRNWKNACVVLICMLEVLRFKIAMGKSIILLEQTYFWVHFYLRFSAYLEYNTHVLWEPFY